MEFVIRKALLKDAADMAMCIISCWHSAYSGIVPDEYLKNMLTEKDKLIARYEDILSNPSDRECYCVTYAGKIMGVLVVQKGNTGADAGAIWAIYLEEEFWGKGYGKKLLAFAINELKKENDEVFLWVLEKNSRARSFYEKNGFYFDGKTEENDNYGKPLVQLRYVYNPSHKKELHVENFDQMAEGYDTDKRIKRAAIIADEIRSHIAAEADKSALEFGCGTGLVGLALKDLFSKLFLVDSSPEMIKQVELKLKSLGDYDIEAFCSDFLVKPPQNLKVDYIFSSLVLHHIMDTEKMLRLFYDMLNDGGCLIVVDLNSEEGGFHAGYSDFEGHNGFDQSDLVKLAEKAGFSVVSINTFYEDTKLFDGVESPYSLFSLVARVA